MMKYSIIFSVFNRAEQLSYVLPTILDMYRDNNQVEILVMDDHCTDGSRVILEEFREKYSSWRSRFRIFDSNRSEAEYDRNPGSQVNFLVSQAKGEVLVIQSAEVAHIDDVIAGLSSYVGSDMVSFATVFNCYPPFFCGDFIALLDTPQKSRHFIKPVSGLPIEANVVVLIVDRLVVGAEAGRIIPQRILKLESADDQVFRFEEYCSPIRPYPWFFCGMIMRETWNRLGGYTSKFPHDVDLGLRMNEAGLKFAFTDTLAVHLNHR